MILRSISVVDFKNIASAEIEFSGGVNCLLGDNGMGKSNMLEAIHFLSFARPSAAMPEAELIRHGSDALLVKGSYLSDTGGDLTLSCGIVRGKGKSLKLNGKEYGRMSEHIGRFPVVAVSPSDSRLVTESADERRRLMDMVISQADRSYLSHLIRYNKALASRNKMLRAGISDPLLYESVESTMRESAEGISESRARWIAGISQVFADYYRLISGSREEASVAYRSALTDATLPEILNRNRSKDMVLGYTSQGIHRDDLTASLGSYSMRRLGSQGQVKTFTIALRFAIFDYLHRAGGIMPILLLDDIFDKLDASRVERIMQLVTSGGNFGQIFITDTNRDHLDEILTRIGGDRSIFSVDNGRFTPMTDLHK